MVNITMVYRVDADDTRSNRVMPWMARKLQALGHEVTTVEIPGLVGSIQQLPDGFQALAGAGTRTVSDGSAERVLRIAGVDPINIYSDPSFSDPDSVLSAFRQLVDWLRARGELPVLFESRLSDHFKQMPWLGTGMEEWSVDRDQAYADWLSNELSVPVARPEAGQEPWMALWEVLGGDGITGGVALVDHHYTPTDYSTWDCSRMKLWQETFRKTSRVFCCSCCFGEAALRGVPSSWQDGDEPRKLAWLHWLLERLDG